MSLSTILEKRTGPAVCPLFELLEDVVRHLKIPWPVLKGMVAARRADLARRALRLAVDLVREEALKVDDEVLDSLAALCAQDGSFLAEPEGLGLTAELLRGVSEPGSGQHDPVLDIYLSDRSWNVRSLAARILDLAGEPVAKQLGSRILGSEAYAFLGDYLQYSRAGHLDLIQLVPKADRIAPALSSLRHAAKICGKDLLRNLIAELGWSRLNLGLDVQSVRFLKFGESFPFTVSAAEADLLTVGGYTQRSVDCYLVVALGGSPYPADIGSEGAKSVAGFKALNQLQADLLADILSVAPPTRDLALRIIERMDRIVSMYCSLFAGHTQDCSILPDLYHQMRAQVLAEVDSGDPQSQLSAEATRLLLTFEDPDSLGEVRTVHGLKRYLHQQGLKLASVLIESSHGANHRSMQILVTSATRILRRSRPIHFVEFDGTAESVRESQQWPYAVSMIVDAFARQLLHGLEEFPEIRIFCYGDEIHNYLNFGNHPALLRVCLAPPSQGGMLDLRFFGVSKYYLSDHPSPTLDGLHRMLSRLDYDVEIENTHVHVRYDKERCRDLEDLCAKLDQLVRLIPYVMDIDWLIGDLDLSAGAREKVADAWADWIERWGVLPVSRLLTADRRGILVSEQAGPNEKREISWSGEGPYRDRFKAVQAGVLQNVWRTRLKQLAMDRLPFLDLEPGRPVGQASLEQDLLLPLRAALSRGEIRIRDGELHCCPSGCYKPLHEAELFAEVLARQDDGLESAASIAQLVRPLERSLKFHATGSINGYEVQRAYLPLVGSTLLIAVLRGQRGIAQLALFATGGALFQCRYDPSDAWESSASLDAAGFASLLRRYGYASPGTEAYPRVTPEDLAGIRAEIQGGNPSPPMPLIAGEQIIRGLRASPGRVVGRALFLSPEKFPRDFQGAVLLAPSLRPEDNAYIYHAGGIVSTGGGVLGHVGLMAMQFRKPALVIPGRWADEDGRGRVIRYRMQEYREAETLQHGYRVTIRWGLRELEHNLREGDLVVLDARTGILRVLGQDPETLAMHEELRTHVDTQQRLFVVKDTRDALMLRGRHLRARYQLEKLLRRLSNPALACHFVNELLLAGPGVDNPADHPGAQAFLSLLLSNPQVSTPVRQYLAHTRRDLVQRCEALCKRAETNIPRLASCYEVLALRRDAVDAIESLKGVVAALRHSGSESAEGTHSDRRHIDDISRARIHELREERLAALESEPMDELSPARRHLLHQIEQIDAVLGITDGDCHPLATLQAALARDDENTQARLARCRTLDGRDGGIELYPLIGWKAANLAEIERLQTGAHIPPWFAVTQRAFDEVMDQPVVAAARFPGDSVREPVPLGRAIEGIVDRQDLDHAQRSAAIRSLWGRVRLPRKLTQEIKSAYRMLAEADEHGSIPTEDRFEPLVSIRSSAREEDAEVAARAGEFDTFLFVRGEGQVMEHLKRAWSGLWTERAIHNRAALGSASELPGGGVIVQRMVQSRVSGVILSVNAGEGELGEMVINAGLGLGEGVVSGSVAADHIVVSKDGNLVRGPLHLRYVIADKREQVVFNQHAGLGTMRSDTLYHQRLRPALEYVELAELVRLASLLEERYGYPIDMEFAIEGARLWILQVRPVAAVISSLKNTLELSFSAGPERPVIHQETSP